MQAIASSTLRLVIIVACLLPWPAYADEIVLNTGERFTSDKVWEENSKIRFNMHGLVVSVEKADVVAVLRSNGGNSHAGSLRRNIDLGLRDTPPTPAAPAAQAKPPATEPAADKPSTAKSPAAGSAPSKPTGANPRITGIGLDGIKWQMTPLQIPGIEKRETSPAYGGIDQYWRPEGNLTLGNVLLDGLVFSFWQNRLYTIMIWVNGRPAYNRLHQAVMNRYGRGKKSAKGLERYIWLEKTTDRMLEFDETSNTGILWMRSRELDRYVRQHYPE